MKFFLISASLIVLLGCTGEKEISPVKVTESSKVATVDLFAPGESVVIVGDETCYRVGGLTSQDL